MTKMGNTKYMTASWNEMSAKTVVTVITSTDSEGLVRLLVENDKWLVAFKAKAITAQDLNQKLSVYLFFITFLTVTLLINRSVFFKNYSLGIIGDIYSRN